MVQVVAHGAPQPIPFSAGWGPTFAGPGKWKPCLMMASAVTAGLPPKPTADDEGPIGRLLRERSQGRDWWDVEPA